MPSLFSKFRHRKSLSQSSNTSADQASPPRSPASASNSAVHRQSQGDSPSNAGSRIRQSLDQPRTPTSPSSSGIRNTGEGLNKRLSQPNLQYNNQAPAQNIPPVPSLNQGKGDVVVIDKSPLTSTGTGRGDEIDSKGHSKPFTDESQRPDLPTTTSNVNNPIPVSHPSSSREGTTATTYIPQDEIEVDPHKPLPAVPEVQSPPVQSNDLGSFPLPPHSHGHADESEFAIPPKSPERYLISHPHPDDDRYRVRSPPLPHVDSVNRQALHHSEEERPGLVGSSSRPLKSGEGEVVQGNYPHVSNLPHSEKEHDLNDLLTTNTQNQNQNDKVEIPSRRSSLHHTHHQNLTGSNTPKDRELPSSSSIPQIPQLDFQTHRRDGEWTGPSSALDPISNHPNGVLNERFNNLSIQQAGEGGSILSLQDQRDAMVSQLSQDIESRESNRNQLTEEGVNVFRKAGIDRVLGTENSVDIRSKEFEPVVKEIIFPLEHTEYTTILTRCIHKTHYLPLIQPIHDPNPIRLATRHRIYDSTTGKWHEVIGDAAAISILGEDVFLNGRKEIRELRKPAYPGLEPMDEDAVRMAKEAGLVSGTGLSTYQGIKDYEYQSNQEDTIPIKGEFKDVSIDGIGQGQGKGRVLEREYVIGQGEDPATAAVTEEEKGDWKEIASYVGIGKGKLSRADEASEDKVGLAM